MSKRKKNKRKQTMPVNIVLPSNISADEMKRIIADGLMKFEEQKKRQEKAAKALQREEWRRTIGFKDFSNVKAPKRWILQFFNTVHAIWKICFASPKDIKGDRVTFGLMQMILSFLFACLSGILLAISVAFLIAPIGLFLVGLRGISWGIALSSLLFSLAAFLLFAMFRIASFEVDNLEDRNYILMLFTCVTGIVAIIVALVK